MTDDIEPDDVLEEDAFAQLIPLLIRDAEARIGRPLTADEVKFALEAVGCTNVTIYPAKAS